MQQKLKIYEPSSTTSGGPIHMPSNKPTPRFANSNERHSYWFRIELADRSRRLCDTTTVMKKPSSSVLDRMRRELEEMMK